MLKDNDRGYGLMSIALHWIMALAIFGLFGLGIYMVDLYYYDAWYKKGPDLHRSLGILLFFLLIFRLVWRLFNSKPQPEPTWKSWEHILGEWMHRLLYIVIFVVIIAGYLMSSADGRGVSVFDWFELPALVTGIDRLEDKAGWVHEWVAWALIVLAGLHAAAAFKHHFVDKDRTLKRMLTPSQKNADDS